MLREDTVLQENATGEIWGRPSYYRQRDLGKLQKGCVCVWVDRLLSSCIDTWVYK